MVREAVGILVLLSAVGCSGPVETPQVVHVDPIDVTAGSPAADFEYVDIHGEAGRLSDFRGRIVLLSTWATWCPHSRDQVPQLVEAYERFHADGFEILGVASDDRLGTVREFVIRNEMDWQHTIEVDQGPIATMYHAGAVPTLVLIDRDGTIVEHDLSGSDVGERVAALIAETSTP